MRTHIHNTPPEIWQAVASGDYENDGWAEFKSMTGEGTAVFFKPKPHTNRHVVNFVHFANSLPEYQAIDIVAEPTNVGESVKHIRVEVPQPVVLVYDLTIYSPHNLPTEF